MKKNSIGTIRWRVCSLIAALSATGAARADVHVA